MKISRAFQLGLLAFAVAGSAQAQAAKAVDPGQCQAAYNAKRNNCTIVGGRCTPGYVPIANPPGCACTCQHLAVKMSKKAKAEEKAEH